MKKASLIAIATGVALVLVAFVWSGFSWQNIQSDLRNISRQDYQDKQATFNASTIKNIKTDLDNVRVDIKTQPDSNQVTVDYFETKADKFTVTGSGDTVTVSREQPADINFFCFFRCANVMDNTIVIRVPVASMLAYDLRVNNAPVNFNNADELQAQTIRAVSSNSNVQLQRIAARGVIDIQSSNGSIRLRDVTTTDKLNLDSSNASSNLVNVQAQTITSRTDNGSATLDTVAAQDLTVDTSNASITLKRLVATRSKLTSDNGSVRGSVQGSKDDYSIKIGSSNGSIRLNGEKHDGLYFSGDDSAAKSLSVQASNALVDIRFED